MPAGERALPLPTSISRFLKREIQAFHCSLLANSWLIPNLPHDDAIIILLNTKNMISDHFAFTTITIYNFEVDFLGDPYLK